MSTKRTDTFRSAVKAFEDASPWLGDADLPARVALRSMADALDGGDLAPALLAQFGLTFRNLQKRAPAEDHAPADPLEAALRGAEG